METNLTYARTSKIVFFIYHTFVCKFYQKNIYYAELKNLEYSTSDSAALNMLMRQRQFEIKTLLLVFTLSKKRALKMEKTHPFTLQNACRWFRKNVPKSPQQLLLRLSHAVKNPRDARRFLKQTTETTTG